MKPITTEWRRSRSGPVIVCALLLGQLAPVGVRAEADLESTFASSGLRPFADPAPAPEFELARLGGGRGALSDYGGRWVVLTFWASWCGPCRSELPSLESVHRSLGERGLVVVGVSVDDESAPAEAFLAEHGLTFPSFHDPRRAAASAYHAASIPVSYLIDPGGAVVAMARGARDWRRLVPALTAALAARPPGEAERAAFASEGPLRMPSVSQPPDASVSVSDSALRPGVPFDLVVDLWWAGDFEEYLPQPPQVQLPEGMERQRVTAETSSRDGRHHVIYRIALQAAEPGRYALDPIELRYTPRFDPEPVVARVAGPTVEVATPVSGLRRAAAGAGGALALMAVVVVGLRRRRGARRSTDDSEGGYQELRELYGKVRALRLQGDVAHCLMALVELERQLGEIGDEEAKELDRWVEAARFGGRTPPLEELDRWQRRAERRLETHRPDPRAAARERLRLRPEAGVRQEEMS